MILNTDTHKETDVQIITEPLIPHQYNLPFKRSIWSEVADGLYLHSGISAGFFMTCLLYVLQTQLSMLCDLFDSSVVLLARERMREKNNLSRPWISSTLFTISKHLIYDECLFMRNLFITFHLYVVVYIQCLTFIFFSPIHYPPGTLTSEHRELLPVIQHRETHALSCKLQHLQHRCESDTASRCSCHKSRALIKWLCYCLKRNISDTLEGSS